MNKPEMIIFDYGHTLLYEPKLTDTAQLPYALDEIIYTYNGITTTEILKGIGLK